MEAVNVEFEGWEFSDEQALPDSLSLGAEDYKMILQGHSGIDDLNWNFNSERECLLVLFQCLSQETRERLHRLCDPASPWSKQEAIENPYRLLWHDETVPNVYQELFQRKTPFDTLIAEQIPRTIADKLVDNNMPSTYRLPGLDFLRRAVIWQWLSSTIDGKKRAALDGTELPAFNCDVLRFRVDLYFVQLCRTPISRDKRYCAAIFGGLNEETRRVFHSHTQTANDDFDPKENPYLNPEVLGSDSGVGEMTAFPPSQVSCLIEDLQKSDDPSFQKQYHGLPHYGLGIPHDFIIALRKSAMEGVEGNMSDITERGPTWASLKHVTNEVIVEAGQCFHLESDMEFAAFLWAFIAEDQREVVRSTFNEEMQSTYSQRPDLNPFFEENPDEIIIPNFGNDRDILLTILIGAKRRDLRDDLPTIPSETSSASKPEAVPEIQTETATGSKLSPRPEAEAEADTGPEPKAPSKIQAEASSGSKPTPRREVQGEASSTLALGLDPDDNFLLGRGESTGFFKQNKLPIGRWILSDFDFYAHHPDSNLYFYDEPPPDEIDPSNDEKWPPQFVYLSSAWIGRLIEAEIPWEDLNKRWPFVFTYANGPRLNLCLCGAPFIKRNENSGQYHFGVVCGRFPLHGAAGALLGVTCPTSDDFRLDHEITLGDVVPDDYLDYDYDIAAQNEEHRRSYSNLKRKFNDINADSPPFKRIKTSHPPLNSSSANTAPLIDTNSKSPNDHVLPSIEPDPYDAIPFNQNKKPSFSYDTDVRRAGGSDYSFQAQYYDERKKNANFKSEIQALTEQLSSATASVKTLEAEKSALQNQVADVQLSHEHTKERSNQRKLNMVRAEGKYVRVVETAERLHSVFRMMYKHKDLFSTPDASGWERSARDASKAITRLHDASPGTANRIISHNEDGSRQQSFKDWIASEPGHPKFFELGDCEHSGEDRALTRRGDFEEE